MTKPVEACPPSTAYRVKKFARRHKAKFLAVATIATVLLIATVVSSSLAAWALKAEGVANANLIQAKEDRADALDARAIAKQQEELAQRQRDAAEYDLYVANIGLATHDWTAGRTISLRDSLDTLFPEPGRPDYRGWEWYYLYSLLHRDRFTFRFQRSNSAITWRSDGKELASVDQTGLINIWDVSNGQLKASLDGCAGTINSISWSPDGGRLAAGGDRRIIVVWDLASGEIVQSLWGHTASVQRVDWNPDGVRLASGGDDGRVLVWDSKSGKRLASLGGDHGGVSSLDWHPDGNQLMAVVGVNRRRTLKIWDTATGEEVASWSEVRGGRAALSPDGSRVVWGDDIIELKARTKISSVAGETWGQHASWSPSGQRLAAPTRGGTGITIRDAETGQEVSLIPSPSTSSVSWSPEGELIALVSSEYVKVFDAAAIPSPLTLSPAGRLPLSVAFSPDGRRLLAGLQYGMLKVWDVESGEETLSIQQPYPFWNSSVAWSPDGRRFASGDLGSSALPFDVRIYDAATGKQMLPPLDCGDEVASLAWSPDGKVLAAGSFRRQFGEMRGRVVLWDADTGRELATSAYAKVTGEEWPVAWRPDGGQLVAGAEGCLRVWDAELREETVVSTGAAWHHNQSLSWSPDGKRLATCTGEAIIIYDATDWTPIREMKSNARKVKWHPDGTRIASATGEGTISIFDTSTGRRVWTCDAHAGRINELDWSPDGMRLASASHDRTVRIWDASPADRFLKMHGELREESVNFWESFQPLERLCELYPEDQLFATQLRRARWLHARNLARWDQPNEAIAGCEQLSAEYSDLPDYRLRLPGVLFEAGHKTKAIELLEGFVKECPERPQYRDELAYLYELRATELCQAGQFDDAMPIVLKLAREFPNRPDFRAQLAFQMAKTDRLDDTLAMFEKTAEAFSDRLDYRSELADHLAATGTHAIAVPIYEQLATAHPDVPDYRARLGSCLAANDQFDRGIAVLRKLVDGFPDVSDYRLELANAYVRRGDAHRKSGELDKAVRDFTEAGRLGLADPYRLNAVALHNLGFAFENQGKLEEAIVWYRQALELNPEAAATHYNLGRALAIQGKLEEAIAECREAIRIKPDEVGAHNILGIALQEQGKLQEAVAEYREAVRLQPDFPEAHVNLGTALKKQGKLVKAIAACREAIRLQPDDAGVHNALGNVLSDQGRLEEAIAAYHEAIRLQPDDAGTHYNLGNALRKQGKPDEAIAAYREALRLQPDKPEALTNLGNLLHEQGKLEEAIASTVRHFDSSPLLRLTLPTPTWAAS